ncbi:MAG: hypothetical protein R3E86_03805 [Pseudomonadales bacterium]
MSDAETPPRLGSSAGTARLPTGPGGENFPGTTTVAHGAAGDSLIPRTFARAMT